MAIAEILSSGIDPTTYMHLAASHAQSTIHDADSINIDTQTPPGSDKWLRIPGLVKWGVMVIGITAIIASAGVMAVEKFTDHGMGGKGMKIAGWAMAGGIVATTASGLYGFITG